MSEEDEASRPLLDESDSFSSVSTAEATAMSWPAQMPRPPSPAVPAERADAETTTSRPASTVRRPPADTAEPRTVDEAVRSKDEPCEPMPSP